MYISLNDIIYLFGQESSSRSAVMYLHMTFTYKDQKKSTIRKLPIVLLRLSRSEFISLDSMGLLCAALL